MASSFISILLKNIIYNVSSDADLLSIANHEGKYCAQNIRWGIIPARHKPGNYSRPIINARSETVWERPSFRNLIKTQRTIIPVSGFYEWKRERTKKTSLSVGGSFHISNRWLISKFQM